MLDRAELTGISQRSSDNAMDFKPPLWISNVDYGMNKSLERILLKLNSTTIINYATSLVWLCHYVILKRNKARGLL